jgi:plastocyanin
MRQRTSDPIVVVGIAKLQKENTMGHPIEQTDGDRADQEPSQNGSLEDTVVHDHSRLEWTMVGTALAGLLSVLAIIVSVVALSSGSPATATAAQPAPVTVAQPAAPRPHAVKMLVKTDAEYGRRGPDGKWHDAFLPADFTVRAGQTVTVTVTNYDSGPHTFTSPSMGVNEVIPGGGSLTAGKQVTFTFTAPSKPGSYQWWCSLPCDPWAMVHNGYMRGIVTVTV